MAGFNIQQAEQIGGGMLGLAGSLAGAYQNVPKAAKADRTLLTMMNQGYKPTDMEGLMAQYNHHQVGAQPISAKDLYNPSTTNAFNSMFGAGMSVYGATKGLTDNLKGTMGTTFINGANGFNTMTGKGWGAQGNMLQANYDANNPYTAGDIYAALPSSFTGMGNSYKRSGTMDWTPQDQYADDIEDQEGVNQFVNSNFIGLPQGYKTNGRFHMACGGHKRAYGGHKFAFGGTAAFDNGAMVGQAINMAGAGLGVALNAIGMAEQKKKAEAEAAAYNFDLQFLRDRQVHDLDSATHDSKNNMFNMQAIQRRACGGRLHAHGGDLSTHGAIFPLWGEYNFIGAGGTHEQNPYSGVPQGLSSDGQENLVEENEVVWNDYVFSQRLHVPDAIRSKYKLREGITYAEAAEKLLGAAKERPNDPISQNTMEAKLGDLMESQEDLRMRREAARVKKQVAAMSPEEIMMLEQSMQDENGIYAAFGGHLFKKGGPKKPSKAAAKAAAAERAKADRRDADLYQKRMNQYSFDALNEIASKVEGYNADDYKGTDRLERVKQFLMDNRSKVGGYDALVRAASDATRYNLLTTAPEYVPTSRTITDNTPYNNSKAAMGRYDKSRTNAPDQVHYEFERNLTPEQVAALEGDRGYKDFTNYVLEQLQAAKEGKEYNAPFLEDYFKLIEENRPGNIAKYFQYDENGSIRRDAQGRAIFADDVLGERDANDPDKWNNSRYWTERNDGKVGIVHRNLARPTETTKNSGERTIIWMRTPEGYKMVDVPKEDIERNNYLRAATHIDGSNYKKETTIGENGEELTTHNYYYDPQEYEENYEEKPRDEKQPLLPTGMRYAPLLAPFLADYTARDYSTAIPPREAAYRPIGDYLTYNPVDSQRYLTAINQQDAARRGAIQNMSGANRNIAMAQDALAEYQRQQDMANILQSAEQINFDRRAKVGDFNRGTNQFNAQAFNTTELANMRIPEFMLHQAANNARMRKAVDDAVDAAKGETISSALDTWHNIGRENFAFNQANQNPALYFTTGLNGDINYAAGKRPTIVPTEDEEGAKTIPVVRGACGGLLTKRSKGRR